MHLSTCSSRTPSTVLLYHICDVKRRRTVGSSYPCVKQSILFACRRAPFHKERPYHRSTFVYTNFSFVKLCSRQIRRQDVQPSNRFGCDKVSYTDVVHSLELENIISETVDPTRTTQTFRQVRAISATFPPSQFRVIPVPEDNC